MNRKMILGGAVAALMLSLSACAMSPVDAPQSDYFAQLAKADSTMPAPADLPSRPHATMLTVQNVDVFAFTAEQANQLMARDLIAEANTTIAKECSAGYNEVTGAYDILLMQAQQHEQIYNRLAERWADAENDLQRQRMSFGVETWANRALMAVAVGLAL